MLEHHYEIIPGWFDFQDLYSRAVQRAPEDAQFLEIGSFMGKSLCYLATEIVNSGKHIELISVDAMSIVNVFPGVDPVNMAASKHNGRALRDVLEAHLGLSLDAGLSWSHLSMTSVEASDLFDNASLDFVFVDGAHDYDSVSLDLWKWWPKVKRGGWMAGHDFTHMFPGVMKSVQEFFPGKWQQSKSSWFVDKG